MGSATTDTATGSVVDLSHADTLDLLHRQTRVLELIAAGAPLPNVLTTITLALEELIPTSHCSVLLFDAEAMVLRHGAAPTLPAAYSAMVDGISVGENVGACGAAAVLGIEIIAEDIAVDPRWVECRELALPHGLRACWSSPIRGRTAILGTFAVYHRVPHLPTPRERRLVERFTHLSAVAIEHGRLFGALTESEERFRRAFEDNAVGMALTDLDGRIGKVNRALREMLGHSEQALLFTDLGSLLTTEVHEAGTKALRKLSEGTEDFVQFETTLLRIDGSMVQAAVTASVVRGADGPPGYLCVNVLDVTARRAAERDRRARREAELARGVAEAASRAKSQFLSAMSHELRSPLQAITGFTELLGTLDLPKQRRDAALGHIAGACTHILSLVDDVLDIARIEADALPLHLADINLGALVGEVVDLLEPLAVERGVELCGRPITCTPLADNRRLRQVLINLVTNGIRYNRAGGWVRVTADRHGPDVGIRVADSGPGIPEELIERLFVPFDRLGACQGSEPGTGLGMVLAHGLTTAMGGQLTVRSRVGEGTTIAVRLPAA